MNRTFLNTKKKSKGPMELDITSLLDILVILLVFLLKSYNASNLNVNLVQNLSLPVSKARKLGQHTMLIQVDKDRKIWSDNNLIATATDNEKVIKDLKTFLEKDTSKKIDKKVNLVFHKDLSYKTIKNVMHTCATSGLTEFKFIVKGIQ